MASNNSQNKNQMFQTIGGIVNDVTALFNKNNNLTREKLVKMVEKATTGLSKTAVNNRIKTALNVLDACIQQQINEAKRLARNERQRAYYVANRDSIRSYQKEYRRQYLRSNPDVYERQLESSRNWKARNRERVLEYQRQYNANKKAEQQRQLEEQQAKQRSNNKNTSKKAQSKRK